LIKAGILKHGINSKNMAWIFVMVATRSPLNILHNVSNMWLVTEVVLRVLDCRIFIHAWMWNLYNLNVNKVSYICILDNSK
jgi:hypothetical protein